MPLQDTTKRPRSVYLLQMVDTNYYKIGIAHDVYARLRSIQTGSPFVIVLIRSFEHGNAVYIEQALHRALHDFHVRGEWYECLYEKISIVFNAYVAPELSTTLVEGTDEESVIRREFIAEVQDRIKNDGVYLAQIAREVGIPRETIHSLIKGRRRHTPSHDPDEDALIRREFIDDVWEQVKGQGFSRDDIDRKVGDSRKTIRDIVKERKRLK